MGKNRCVRRDVAIHGGAESDSRMVADSNGTENDGVSADENIVAERRPSLDRPVKGWRAGTADGTGKQRCVPAGTAMKTESAWVGQTTAGTETALRRQVNLVQQRIQSADESGRLPPVNDVQPVRDSVQEEALQLRARESTDPMGEGGPFGADVV